MWLPITVVLLPLIPRSWLNVRVRIKKIRTRRAKAKSPGYDYFSLMGGVLLFWGFFLSFFLAIVKLRRVNRDVFHFRKCD